MEMPPLILVSNRGPVRFTDDGEGGTAMLRSDGGLVTALSGLMNVVPAVWISAAIDDADARVINYVVVPGCIPSRYGVL